MRSRSIIGPAAILFAVLVPASGADSVIPAPGAPTAYTEPLATRSEPPQPTSPLAASLALALPAAAGGYLAAALLRARRMACPPCPVCGSRRGAVVGPVGQYHNCCRCHDCGHLWEKDPAAMSRTVAAARAHRPPGEIR